MRHSIFFTNICLVFLRCALMMSYIVCSTVNAEEQLTKKTLIPNDTRQNVLALKNNLEPTIRTFSDPISGFYNLDSHASNKGYTNLKDVYVLLDTKGSVNKLFSYSTGKQIYSGCKFTKDKTGIFFVENLHGNICDKRIQEKIRKGLVSLPDCNIDATGASPTSADYFYNKNSSKAVCLYQYSNNSKALADSEGLKLVKVHPSKKSYQGGLLNAYFETAPYLSGGHSIDKARNCTAYPLSVGALKDSTQEELVFIDDKNLAWSYLYLVKSQKKFKCADAVFLIDSASNIGPRLMDGTAIIYGSVSALRVNLLDGLPLAGTGSVKAIPAQVFIEKMQSEGGESCVNYVAQNQCKWLVGYTSHGGDKAKEDEQYYGKFWYQGFNNEVRNLFFKNKD